MVSNSKLGKEKLVRVDGKDSYLGGKFSILSLLYLWFRSTTMIQGSFNYGYFQGSGYSQAIFPFLKRIYAGNKEKLKTALIDNIEFFNSGPCLGISVITTLHLLMLQKGQDNASAKTIKFALMGPLAGINDALFNFGSQPLFAGIAAGLSAQGSISGFWFWMLVYNGFQFSLAITATILTYKSGEKLMKNLSHTMSGIIKIASMIGITIIGALAITYTSFSLSIETVTPIISQGDFTVKVTSYQAVLDKLVPMFLPIVLVGFLYFMMSKFNWSLYRAMGFCLLLGITGYVFGVL